MLSIPNTNTGEPAVVVEVFIPKTAPKKGASAVVLAHGGGAIGMEIKYNR
jgi:hypothetical protein